MLKKITNTSSKPRLCLHGFKTNNTEVVELLRIALSLRYFQNWFSRKTLSQKRAKFSFICMIELPVIFAHQIATQYREQLISLNRVLGSFLATPALN